MGVTYKQMKPTTSKEEQVISDSLQSVREQLKDYPTPITGCDEQFNFLLTERNRLTQALNKVRSEFDPTIKLVTNIMKTNS